MTFINPKYKYWYTYRLNIDIELTKETLKMKTRKCIHCGITGDESILFTSHTSNRKDGSKYFCYTNCCKKCTAKIVWKYEKAKKETDPCEYYANATWKSLNQRCVNGLYCNSKAVQNSPQMISYHKKGIEIHITQTELKQFWKDNEVLVKSILTSGGTPTIDRILESGHYTLDNIQILERKANIHKSRGVATNPACVDKEAKRIENRLIYIAAQKKGKK